MSLQVINGDCREVLKTLPADSVHCCVTSPPYWGLRDYGVSGQIGLESTFTDFVAEMVKVFREVRRVLRPDGTLWLNLGDSYAGGKAGNTNGGASSGLKRDGRDEGSRLRTNEAFGADMAAMNFRKPMADGLKPKDLVGIPWRVAFALQADGWWLRQDIIWSKPNPMPESVTDRCTKAHEYVFLMSKSPRYYYDAEAISEAAEHRDYATWDERKEAGEPNRRGLNAGMRPGNSQGLAPKEGRRNKRSVWEIATHAYPEAHFATFPPALVEPCIKAGTSERGCCGKCGAPWERRTEKSFEPTQNPHFSKGGNKGIDASNGWGETPRGRTNVETLGWSPTCKCNASVVPCTVLDCFGGAGTTALVADRLQRNAILIELNPTYAEMAKRRIYGDAPLLASVTS